MRSLDIYNISSPSFLPLPLLSWCWLTMQITDHDDVPSLLARNAGSVFQCCDSGYNCLSSWRLIQSSPAPSARISPALVSVRPAERGWTGVWGENFIKLYHLSCPWPALFCRLVCFREFYGVINYRNTSAVPGYTLFIFYKTLYLEGVQIPGFGKFIFLCVIHDTQRKSFTILNLMGCSTFPVTLP